MATLRRKTRGFELIGDSNDAEVAKFNELTEKYKAGTLTKDQYENELIIGKYR